MASHIERRKFLATLGAAAPWPLAARAQQPKMLRLGFVGIQILDRQPILDTMPKASCKA